MADKKNQQEQSNVSTSNMDQQERDSSTSGQNINVENPQQGDQWENYRTRELSSHPQTDDEANAENNLSGTERTSE